MDMSIIGIGGIALGALLLIFCLAKIFDKKATSQVMTGLGLVLLVGGILVMPGVLPEDFFGGETLAVIPGVPSGTPAGTGVEFCAVEDTTITLSATDKYTSAATGGTHRYMINGAPAKTVSNAGTFTASPGDVISILYENASTTGYFSEIQTVVVPCSGTKTFYKELAQNGTLTIQIYNEEGQVIDAAADQNETLAAGDVVTLDASVKGQYQRAIPYGMVLVVEYNKTSTDDVIVGSTSGVTYASASLPQSFSPTYGTDSTTRVYDFPAITSNEKKEFLITVDADDDENPAVDTSNIIFTFYMKNYFIDADSSGAFSGPSVEDEDNAVTRVGQHTSTLYVD